MFFSWFLFFFQQQKIVDGWHIRVALFQLLKKTRKRMMMTCNLHEVCFRFAEGEQCTCSSVVHSLNERETNLRIVELFNVWPSAFARSDCLNFDNLEEVNESSQLHLFANAAHGNRKKMNQLAMGTHRPPTELHFVSLTWIEWALARWRAPISR